MKRSFVSCLMALVAGVCVAQGIDSRVADQFSTTKIWTNQFAPVSVDRITVVFPAAVANTAIIYQVTMSGSTAITSLLASVGSASATTYSWAGLGSPVNVFRSDKLIISNNNTNPAWLIMSPNVLK